MKRTSAATSHFSSPPASTPVSTWKREEEEERGKPKVDCVANPPSSSPFFPSAIQPPARRLEGREGAGKTTSPLLILVFFVAGGMEAVIYYYEKRGGVGRGPKKGSLPLSSSTIPAGASSPLSPFSSLPRIRSPSSASPPPLSSSSPPLFLLRRRLLRSTIPLLQFLRRRLSPPLPLHTAFLLLSPRTSPSPSFPLTCPSLSLSRSFSS